MKLSSLDKLPEGQVSHNPAIRKRVLLASGALPHLVNFARAVFPPGEIAGAHVHEDMNEVFFVDSGSGVILIDGREYALTPGTCVTVEAGETHELRNTGQDELVLIYFAIESATDK